MKCTDLLTFTLYNAKILKKYIIYVKRGGAMQEVRILHIADMHLGSVFAGLSSDKAKTRRNEATYNCLKAINDALSCDALLLSGDIFNSGDVSVSLLDTFLKAVSDLGDIPVFYSCGNHDSYYTHAVQYCLNNLPSNLHIFPPDIITFYTLNNLKLRVYGSSFADVHVENSLVDSSLSLDSEYINILCIHGDTSPGVYNYINLNTLKTIGFDYVALGHIHSYSGIKKIGNCHYAYPGIPEGRGFDECGDKGYIKGTVSKGEVNLEFITLSNKKYLDEKIDVSDFENEYELVDVINSFCPNKTEVCRFTLVGMNNFLKEIDLNFLKSQCNAYSSAFFDETKQTVNPEDYLGFSGLKGFCAKETLRLMECSTTDEEKEEYKKAFCLLLEHFDMR